MDRIPNARDLTPDEMKALRSVVSSSYVLSSHINAEHRSRLITLGLIHYAMGGLMPTPAGRVVARM
jgi:hypothetical protein